MKKAEDLNIGGLVRLTTLDYPEHLSAVVFCQGCPWRCKYCYNTHLLSTEKNNTFSWEAVIHFLGTRCGLLDAVVFSGGEPTAQSALLPAMQQVKSMGFLVALHTAGVYPKFLKQLIPFLDWVGLDIKAPFAQYAHTTNVQGAGKRAEESLHILLESRIPFECRTTVHWDLLSKAALTELAKKLRELGVKNYSVQSCKATAHTPFLVGDCLLETEENHPLWDLFRSMFPVFTVR